MIHTTRPYSPAGRKGTRQPSGAELTAPRTTPRTPAWRAVLMAPAIALMLGTGLSACGGDPAPVDTPPPMAEREVPASATASPEAYARYAASATADDSAEPLSVDKVEPPTSETAEPVEGL
ncbi:MAG: hypothetical protein JNJ71_20220 [Rubrivivax sp.]|nr:hypothetical protein [Rubrivivax sp.]